MRVGLVGPEESIRKHLDTLHQNSQVDISGYLCNGSCGDMSDTMVKAFPPRAFDAFIEQSDAFIFCGSGMEYYHYAIQAIRNTRHIFFDQYVLDLPARLGDIQKLSGEANSRVYVRNNKRSHAAWNHGLRMLENPQYAEFVVSDLPPDAGLSNETWVKRLAMDIDLLIDVVNTGVKRTSPTGISVMQKEIDLLNLKIEFINGFAANMNYRVMADSRMERAVFYEKGSVVDIDFLNCSVTRKSQFEHKKFSIVNKCGADSELENFIGQLLLNDKGSPRKFYDMVLPLQIAQQAVEKIQHRHPVHYT